MTQITRRLAEFAAEINFDDLPAKVAERTGALVMDQFGIAFRARQDAVISRSIQAALERLGLANGNACVIGDPRGYAPPGAAFFNGALGHCLDFDDTHARGSIPRARRSYRRPLAAAEMTGAGGRDCIAAITAGYEIQIRLSLALNPSEHYTRGFHPTATCGVFGAAAAAGRLFGATPEQLVHAFGLCGSQAAGSMEFLNDGAWNKPFHVGYAAMNGLVSASLAIEGFTGTRAAIEGRAGFLSAYAPRATPETAVDGLGQHWETADIAVKPYPSCRYGHAAMDALIALREEADLDPNDIREVEIGLPETGWRLIGDPEAEKQRPKNYVDGQFSMPFVAAVALREGAMTWDSYEQHLGDEATLDLCRRTRSVVDQNVQALFPERMAGSARIRTAHDEHHKLVEVAKGEPENFLTESELRAKFDGLVGTHMESAPREALADALLGLEALPQVSEALALSRPSAPSTPSIPALAS